MNKSITGLIIAIVLVAIAAYGGTMLAVAAAVAVVLMMFNVLKFEGRPSKVLNILALVGIVVLGGLIPATWGMPTAPALPTASITSDLQVAPSQQASAALKLNMKNSVAGTYAYAGTVYALTPGILENRNDLMKMVHEGKTAALAPNSMSLSSGVFSYAGYPGRIGDTVYLAGYYDATPAAAEPISFVKKVTLTGITAGSTPEWMISEPTYVWYNYSTLAFYDDTETARTIYTEDEDTAIEKTLTFRMFPTNNGEQWMDAALYIEAPSSNAGAFTKVKIISPEGQIVEYTSLQSTGQMSSSDPRFIAAPALTTSTDTMYYVGKFPVDSVRTSTTEKAKYTVDVTYNHPASGSVNTYFKVVSNSNALTVSGGHFDSPSTNLNLNMTGIGTDGWS